MARLVTFMPRLVVLTVVWLLATAALTYAAGQRMSTAPKPAQTAPIVKAAPKVLVVPDVQRQAYVFAKGILQDGGFAWVVKGQVQGFSVNLVATQTPAPGTRVLDTGAPTVKLVLVRGHYPQQGSPENSSPYAGTALRLADLAASTVAPRGPVMRHASAAKPAVKPAVHKPAAPKFPQQRPPAFVVPGAGKEPLDEMPLPDRARLLKQWLETHPQASNANVRRWLYQHAWIVTGAREGWWHGADALEILIAADKDAQADWGIGARSESVARATLAEVGSRSR